MNKKIKDSYSNVVVSKELENKIMKCSLEGKKEFKRHKVSLAIGIICLLLFLATRVNAEDIEKFWVRVFNMGAIKDINGKRYQMYEEVKGVKFNDIDLSNIVTEEEFETTVNEVENLVGVKLLKYDNATSNDIRCELMTDKYISSKKKAIGRIYLRQLDFYRPEIYGWDEINESNYGFSLNIKLVSEAANNQTKLDYLEELNTMACKKIIEKYHSDNLDTDVLIYEYACEGVFENDFIFKDKSYSEVEAMFIYKNIRYEMNGIFDVKEGIPVDKIKEIIEELHE